MSRLAEYLAGQAGRQVVDNTALEGEYDFTVEWSTDDCDPSRPSVFAALEEQLGLKLVSTKGAIEMIVVDRAESLRELTIRLSSMTPDGGFVRCAAP